MSHHYQIAYSGAMTASSKLGGDIILHRIDRASRADSARPSCLHCVEKHISASIVALSEVEAGYPAHRLLVMGHLHEASEEARQEYPELADTIREIRLHYYNTGEFPTIYEWYDLLEQYATP